MFTILVWDWVVVPECGKIWSLGTELSWDWIVSDWIVLGLNCLGLSCPRTESSRTELSWDWIVSDWVVLGLNRLGLNRLGLTCRDWIVRDWAVPESKILPYFSIVPLSKVAYEFNFWSNYLTLFESDLHSMKGGHNSFETILWFRRWHFFLSIYKMSNTCVRIRISW